MVGGVGEVCGGSLRESDGAVLRERLEEVDPSGGLSASLAWYLDLRTFGGVPSGGFGLGLDRLLLLLLGKRNIKDVVPFPRSTHNCPM